MIGETTFVHRLPTLRQMSLPVTGRGDFVPPEKQLVLSLFSGVGLLDMAFEEAGFCIVRGPDLIWGGDVRRFHLSKGRVDGVIGGPPCQDFSSARRKRPTGNGRLMLAEFVRIVDESQPDWWLLENVPSVPDVKIAGYNWQRLDVKASEFGLKQRRLRHIQFGSRRGMCLVLKRNAPVVVSECAVMASDGETPWEKFVELQGLPKGFDIPAFTVSAKRRAVGNGVPLPMGRALAVAVANMVPVGSVRLCGCSCGRPLVGNQKYAGAACRMRMMRRRQKKGEK